MPVRQHNRCRHHLLPLPRDEQPNRRLERRHELGKEPPAVRWAAQVTHVPHVDPVERVEQFAAPLDDCHALPLGLPDLVADLGLELVPQRLGNRRQRQVQRHLVGAGGQRRRRGRGLANLDPLHAQVRHERPGLGQQRGRGLGIVGQDTGRVEVRQAAQVRPEEQASLTHQRQDAHRGVAPPRLQVIRRVAVGVAHNLAPSGVVEDRGLGPPGQVVVPRRRRGRHGDGARGAGGGAAPRQPVQAVRHRPGPRFPRLAGHAGPHAGRQVVGL